jgi:hypothetical protein
MKSNIKILTELCCDKLANFSTNEELRKRYDQETFGDSDLEYIKTATKYFIDEDLELGIDPKDDCTSSIEIFKQLNNLDRVQANDKRLWTCLTHTRFFGYTKNRWKIDKESSDGTIKSRFHFEGSALEARMRNAISRLWWAAKITYDPARENNFELTELLWEKQDVYTALAERSFATYPNLIHGFLEFFKLNRQLREDELRAILRGLNAVGGVKILPILSKEGVIDQIKRISNYNKIQVT